MKLSELIQNLPFTEKRHFSDVDITGISSHSAGIRPGNLFVAVVGTKVDGHNFIEEAITHGAAALVVEKEISAPKAFPVFRVKDSRASMSRLAAKWFDHPSKKIPVIGITGTNGKTTITYLLNAIFEKAGRNPGVIGTIGYRHGGRIYPTTHTTPDAHEVQRILAEMTGSGVDLAIMEISSHAVDLRRVDDVEFDLAVFTNLTPEHLDYHKSMELYFDSKRRLFTRLLPKGKGLKRSVINADDHYGQKLIEMLSAADLWTYSTKAQSKWTVYVQKWTSSLSGMAGTIATPEGTAEFTSPLIGAFNLSNIVAAASAAQSLGVPLATVVEAVAGFAGVPGRLERIANEKGIHVFVDYAHTPDALKNVLKALKDLDAKRIVTVFGCGGDRDKAKRPIMGREAARLSDAVVVTSDNPRTENPQDIVKAILPGIEEGGMTVGKDAMIELDRKAAIELAIAGAAPGDVVLIAGKGHEDYQILGTEKIHFDDREVARGSLNK